MAAAKKHLTQPALPLSVGSILAMAASSLAALVATLWPWFLSAGSDYNAISSTILVMVVLPLLMLLVMAQLANGAMDTKALALLGVLAALIAALRPLGAGVGGVETVFFLMILAGRVFGPGFGFALGGVSMMASALLTGGVGPWLGMQMVCSAWIGAGAGLLPKQVGHRTIGPKAEIALLAGYGVVTAYLFGALMNLWFWPALAGAGGTASGIGFMPGAPISANLGRFLSFTLITSTTSWDTVRAITCATAIVLFGRPIMRLLRRTSHQAAFSGHPSD
ncbi:MAG: ECF transporter S component [Micrococcales bacterium]|nr:ECF transporter S component [Micrococcales bacterium]